jgi:tetratricopeptide (TPR) repeat protein/predicted GH43/DUF377 family glycosyl hydrolase
MKLYRKLRSSIGTLLRPEPEPTSEELEVEIYQGLSTIEKNANLLAERANNLKILSSVIVTYIDKAVDIDPFAIKRIASHVSPSANERMAFYKHLGTEHASIVGNPLTSYLINDAKQTVNLVKELIAKKDIDDASYFLFIESAMEMQDFPLINEFMLHHRESINNHFGKLNSIGSGTFLNEQDINRSLKALSLYTNARPGLLWAIKNIEQLLIEKEYSVTKKFIVELSKHYPDNDWLLAQLGIANAELGNHEEAYKNYKESYELNFHNDSAFNGYFSSATILGKTDTLHSLLIDFLNVPFGIGSIKISPYENKPSQPLNPESKVKLLSKVLELEHKAQFTNSRVAQVYTVLLDSPVYLEAHIIQNALYYAGSNEVCNLSILQEIYHRFESFDALYKTELYNKLKSHGLAHSPSFYVRGSDDNSADNKPRSPIGLIALAASLLSDGEIEEMKTKHTAKNKGIEYISIKGFFKGTPSISNSPPPVTSNNSFSFVEIPEGLDDYLFRSLLKKALSRAKDNRSNAIALINENLSTSSVGDFITGIGNQLGNHSGAQAIAIAGKRNRNFSWGTNLKSEVTTEGDIHSAILKSPCVIATVSLVEKFLATDLSSIFDFCAFLLHQQCMIIDSFGELCWDETFFHPENISGQIQPKRWSSAEKNQVSVHGISNSEYYELPIDAFGTLSRDFLAETDESGVFNPSLAVNDDGDLLCAVRIESNFNAWSGKLDALWRTHSHTAIINLEGQGNLTQGTAKSFTWNLMQSNNFPDKCRVEDFRIFNTSTGLLATAAVFIENPFKISSSELKSLNLSFSDSKLSELISEDRIVFQTVCDVSTLSWEFTSTKRINLLRDFDHVPMAVEKNWSFFERDQQLHFLHSMIPFRHFQIGAKACNEEDIYYQWDVKGDNPKYPMSIGSHAIPVADDHYLFAYHTRTSGYTYHNGLCSLSFTESGQALATTSSSILSTKVTLSDSCKHENVLYVSSVARQGDVSIIGFGLYDTKAVIMFTDDLTSLSMSQATTN